MVYVSGPTNYGCTSCCQIEKLSSTSSRGSSLVGPLFCAPAFLPLHPYPACPCFPHHPWDPGLAWPVGCSGAEFGSDSSWTFKPNPCRQITDSCHPDTQFQAGADSPAPNHQNPISCDCDQLGACPGQERPALGYGGPGLFWARGFCPGGEKAASLRRSQWLGSNVTSTGLKREADPVFAIYSRCSDLWTRECSSAWPAFSVIHLCFPTVFLFRYLITLEMLTKQLSKHIGANLQSISWAHASMAAAFQWLC